MVVVRIEAQPPSKFQCLLSAANIREDIEGWNMAENECPSPVFNGDILNTAVENVQIVLWVGNTTLYVSYVFQRVDSVFLPLRPTTVTVSSHNLSSIEECQSMYTSLEIFHLSWNLMLT